MKTTLIKKFLLTGALLTAVSTGFAKYSQPIDSVTFINLTQDTVEITSTDAIRATTSGVFNKNTSYNLAPMSSFNMVNGQVNRYGTSNFSKNRDAHRVHMQFRDLTDASKSMTVYFWAPIYGASGYHSRTITFDKSYQFSNYDSRGAVTNGPYLLQVQTAENNYNHPRVYILSNPNCTANCGK